MPIPARPLPRADFSPLWKRPGFRLAIVAPGADAGVIPALHLSRPNERLQVHRQPLKHLLVVMAVADKKPAGFSRTDNLAFSVRLVKQSLSAQDCQRPFTVVHVERSLPELSSK
jgi:hypothetical protein